MDKKSYNGSFVLQWHITHRCNLRCNHCYQDNYTVFESRDSLEKTLDQFSALLKEYRFKGHINVTGGEPLVHPELFWLLKEARSRGITTAVLTNGTLIDENKSRRLSVSSVDYVQVSLDGTRKTHDKIRGEGSFDKAVRGIRNLTARGIFTTVSFTAQRENYKELAKLARYCKNLGVNKLWFDRVVIPSDEDEKKLSLTTDNFSALCKKASKLNKNNMVSCARALQFIPCENKNIYKCTAGKTLLAVLADGSVMACRRLPLIVGNTRENDLLTIYRESPELKKLRSLDVPEKCAKCEYAEMCAGGAKCITCARTGRYDLADPDCPLQAF